MVRTIKQNAGKEEYRQEVILFPVKLDAQLREFIHDKYPNDSHGKIKFVVTQAVKEYMIREEKKLKTTTS